MPRVIILVLAFLPPCIAASWGQEARRAESILLNGKWEFALGNGSEQPFQQDAQGQLDCRQWTPENPVLYVANVSLRNGDEVLDQARIRFGMRDIQVVGGNYQLNGKTLWIRGSNLVHEWDWADIITGVVCYWESKTEISSCI